MINIAEMQYLAGRRPQSTYREARRKPVVVTPAVKSPLRLAFEDLASSSPNGDYSDAEDAFSSALVTIGVADNIEDTVKLAKIVSVLPERRGHDGAYDDYGGSIGINVDYPRGLILRVTNTINVVAVANQLKKLYPEDAVREFMKVPAVAVALQERMQQNLDEHFHGAVGDRYWLYGSGMQEKVEEKIYSKEHVDYTWTDENGHEQEGLDWRVLYKYNPTKVEHKIDVTPTAVIGTTQITIDVEMDRVVLPWHYDWRKYA